MIYQKKQRKSKLVLVISIIVSVVLLSCCGVIGFAWIQKPKPVIVKARSEIVLGTVCGVNLYDDGTAELYDELFERLNEIDEEFNVNKETSQISQINAAAGDHAVTVGEDVLGVITKSLRYSALTDGSFDPTIGPLVKLWGINTEHARVPSTKEIRDTLELVNWRDVVIDGNTVMLKKKGMALDLGGIAKGFAADELDKIISEKKVKRAIIDLGGNIYVHGEKPDKTLWRVGIKDPENSEGDPALALSIKSSTVVTSGVYERFFMQNGKRFHHILDPKTGYPAESGLLSSTIICSSSADADALSTSVFILGLDKGLELIKKIDNTSAVFIGEDKKITATKSLEGFMEAATFKYTDIEYK